MGESLVQKVRDKLSQVSDSEDSIRLISLWIIKHKDDAAELAEVWRDEVISASPKRRLLLIYIANDVIQTGRKRAPGMKTALQPHIRDALAIASGDGKFRSSVEKVIKVWSDRSIFPKSVLAEFERALSGKPVAASSSASGSSSSVRRKPSRPSSHVRSVSEFKVASLTDALQNFKQFSSEVALKHAALAGIRTDIKKSDITNNVKDRVTGGRLLEDLEEASNKLSDYCDSVNVELQDRRFLLQLLNNGLSYHQSRLNQAKAIQEEFSVISKRVTSVRERLTAKLPVLLSQAADNGAGSPVAPAVEALSPGAGGDVPYDVTMAMDGTMEVADMDLDNSDEEPPGPSPQPSPIPSLHGAAAAATGAQDTFYGGSELPTTSTSLAVSAVSPYDMSSPGSTHADPASSRPHLHEPYFLPSHSSQQQQEQQRLANNSQPPTFDSMYAASGARGDAPGTPGTPSSSAPPSPGTPEEEAPPGPDEGDAPMSTAASSASAAQQSTSNMLNILSRLLSEKKSQEGQQAKSGTGTDASLSTAASGHSDQSSRNPQQRGTAAPASLPTAPNGKPLTEILDSILPTLMGTLQKVQAVGPGTPVRTDAAGERRLSATDSVSALDLSATGVSSTTRAQPLAHAADIDPLSNTTGSVASLPSLSWANGNFEQAASSVASSSTAGAAGTPTRPQAGRSVTSPTWSQTPSVAMKPFQAISSPPCTDPSASVSTSLPGSVPPPSLFSQHPATSLAFSAAASSSVSTSTTTPQMAIAPPIPPPGMPPFPGPPPFLQGAPQPPGPFGPPPPMLPGAFGMPPNPPGVPPMPFPPIPPIGALPNAAVTGDRAAGPSSAGFLGMPAGPPGMVDGLNMSVDGKQQRPTQSQQSASMASDIGREGDETPPLEELEAAADAGTSVSGVHDMAGGSRMFPPMSSAQQQQHHPAPHSSGASFQSSADAIGRDSPDGWQPAPLKRGHFDMDAHIGPPPARRSQADGQWPRRGSSGHPPPSGSGGANNQGYFETPFGNADDNPPGHEWPSW
ncbi:proline-rich protein 36-like [Sycon ciliatum]|uniref:proline-rich protein 36-like n=1 Tax=Sycon ciliatum TaxID=27933 RepID=UPI0031F6B743